MTLLAGTVSIVTGAASGIGRRIVQAFVASGSSVIALDTDAELLCEQYDGTQVESSAVDVTDSRAVEQTIAAVVARTSHIDILVNAAGVYRSGPLLDFDIAVAEELLRINVLGTLIPSQWAARAMRHTGGSIVNISSVAAQLSTETNGMYGATKGAVESLTRGLAVSLAEHSIRVNAVAPGPIHTPMTADTLSDPENASRMLDRIVLNTLGTPADVANAALFLASPSSAWITGTILTVDGGVRALR
ncbi:hypothetical protein CH286_20725 [Rhodococcus sp. WWJCD1]|uniref:SDR family NAD(P)-dependent oxidoreductase n=1 Tax=Rhodococcus sp. WWJCD1 TaxID=2022519 RepID=UPI000B9A76EC|nr:SDR family oxidoreductase [Rhodococcus sp. WWJCD1]OZC44389.1 hypothetical protein CH286_20725 [Rhodococcus sp. WWJCD1]